MVEAPAGGPAYRIDRGTPEHGFTTIPLAGTSTVVTLTSR
jgi:hypothetical protein